VSPDGAWIAYIADGELRKVPAGGGSAITLTDSVMMLARSATWLDDGSIVFVDVMMNLRRVPDVGGPSEIVWTPSGGRHGALPVGLPGGSGVLFKVCDNICPTVQEAWVLDLRSGEARLLFPDVAQSWYAATGHLVYVRPDGSVFAVPFDHRSLEVRGAPIRVLDGVKVDGGLIPDFALSRSGTLLMLAGSSPVGAVWEAAWVERDGTATPIDPDWRFDALTPALSPDGTRLALAMGDEAGWNIWIKQLDRGPLSRLTFDDAWDGRPRWTPDGRAVTFVSERAGQGDLYTKRADGTGPAELLLDLEQPIWEGLWSRDGTWLVARTGGLSDVAGGPDLWRIRPGLDSVAVPLVVTEFDETAATLSPDGRWLAYVSNETGRDEVYVRPLPDTDTGKWQVSTGGGSMPLWAHSGRELFYMNDAREMVAAQVETAPSFAVRERRVLFPIASGYRLSANYTAYDVTPDDRRFVMVRAVSSWNEEAAPGALILVENWFEELKAKVGN
jgi:serine/threonine-protein kinase